MACAWHCAPYDWVVLALPVWLLASRIELSPIEKRGAVLAFILPWGFVAIADAIGFHPAMPFLCVVAVWMLRRARRELQLGAS